MTTSANITVYTVRKNGKRVHEHRQHMLCQFSLHELLQFQPESEYTIQTHWVDEEESLHDYEEIPLASFLDKYRLMGSRYLKGCTIEECFDGPITKWGTPDVAAIKAARQSPT